MAKIIDIELTPEEYHVERELFAAVSKKMRVSVGELSHVEVIRRSLDSRRGVRYRATVEVYLRGEEYVAPDFSSPYQDVQNAERVVIVGAGPAGLYAALHCLEVGLKPIVIDRGKPVEERKLDIVKLAREKCVNPESN